MDDLSALQRQMAVALRHASALDRDPRWCAFASAHFGGSDRLSPVEQLEIYREQFWLRHTSSLVEDFPGLGGILGQTDWERLTEQYLKEVVPDSYTLRDLGCRLPEVIERASWLPHQALCLDMARLELAYIDVFDEVDSPVLSPERLSQVSEDELLRSRLVIAPSVRLLEVRYPVADLRRALRDPHQTEVAIPGQQPQCLVIYRRERRLWDMPVSPVAFALLRGFRQGLTLGAAAEAAVTSPETEAELATHIGTWFGEWTGKGLICDLVLD